MEKKKEEKTNEWQQQKKLRQLWMNESRDIEEKTEKYQKKNDPKHGERERRKKKLEKRKRIEFLPQCEH